MATSLMSSVNIPSISSSISTETSQIREQMGTGYGLSKTSFLCGNTKKLFSSQSKRVLKFRKSKSLISASSLNHIPKQFREENLKDGLMENYKNVPSQFYGLSPSQMDMFATKDSPIFRQSAKLKEESLSSAWSYADSCGMRSMSGMKDGDQSTYCSMKVSMYRGGYKRTSGGPPDLPSLLLDSRIVYLGMPIVPPVAELINAQLLYLSIDDPDRPIYLYINSLGIKNERGQIVADDVNAYAIADLMTSLFPDKVYTVNLSTAYGQAAMLLSRGTKGKRFVQPNSGVKLYLPSMNRMNGQTTDIYIESKELQASTNIFLELLSEGIGKPVEVVREDIRLSKYFNAQQAIDYGIVDQLVPPQLGMNEKNDKASSWAGKKNRPGVGGEGAQAAPSGS